MPKRVILYITKYIRIVYGQHKKKSKICGKKKIKTELKNINKYSIEEGVSVRA